MSFPDTVPTLHVSSTQGVCRISGPPEIETKITINRTDLTLINFYLAQLSLRIFLCKKIPFSQLLADCMRVMAPVVCMMAGHSPL